MLQHFTTGMILSGTMHTVNRGSLHPIALMSFLICVPLSISPESQMETIRLLCFPTQQSTCAVLDGMRCMFSRTLGPDSSFTVCVII